MTRKRKEYQVEVTVDGHRFLLTCQDATMGELLSVDPDGSDRAAFDFVIVSIVDEDSHVLTFNDLYPRESKALFDAALHAISPNG